MIDNDWILGCLLAGAFGDAFCAPFEGVDKDEAWEEYDKEEYLKNPCCEFTDDTHRSFLLSP